MDTLDSLGKMVRFANRIRNTYPELVSDVISKQIDEAMAVISINSDLKDSNILKHQVATDLPESKSLNGCPFHYCDKNPKCDKNCRYSPQV